MNLLLNTYRLQDENIRPGNSPTDILLSTARVEKGSTTKIKVPYQIGTKIAWIPMEIAVVDDNQEIEVVAGANDEFIQMFTRSMNLQISGDAL